MKLNNTRGNESVLVIVLAETRAYQHTFELFNKNLLQVMGADLCLCVARNEREDTDNPFYQNAKYIWQYDEMDDWGDAYDDMQRIKSLNANWRKLLGIKDHWLGGVKGDGEQPGSAGILLFFRLFLKESIIKHDILDKYDRFIITRSDFVHRVPHVPLQFLDKEYIWIPDGEDYGGFTDRHIVVQRDDLMDVISISDEIIYDPGKLFSKMINVSDWNLEKYIKFSFTEKNLISKIRRFPYTMYSVRPVGGHTSWSEGYYDDQLGYYIKYKSEYENYLIAARLVSEKKGWNESKIRRFFTIKNKQGYDWKYARRRILQIIKQLVFQKKI